MSYHSITDGFLEIASVQLEFCEGLKIKMRVTFLDFQKNFTDAWNILVHPIFETHQS